ncbi:MAG: hypothetical protein JST00_30880 [Deltaproteobacteria bacterium]|nr:hypothetical protein [Deltaproteobacteria bacterium]
MTFARAISFFCLSAACVLFAGCAGARPSQWELRAPSGSSKMVCTCRGAERSPSPTEASSESDDRVVTVLCEGEVSDCREIRGSGRSRQLD